MGCREGEIQRRIQDDQLRSSPNEASEDQKTQMSHLRQFCPSNRTR